MQEHGAFGYNRECDVAEKGLLVQDAVELYRGDVSGLKSVGFRSFEAKSQGNDQALAGLLDMDLDELERRMEDHANSRFLSWFVSATSDIRVACYFATNGCKNDGSIYVLTRSPLARANPFDTVEITLCDGKTVVKEMEWVWFSYVDPSYIVAERPVTPADCECLPNP